MSFEICTLYGLIKDLNENICRIFETAKIKDINYVSIINKTFLRWDKNYDTIV